MECRQRADFAGAGVIGEPASAGAGDAFLDAEQGLGGRTAEADQNIGVGKLDLTGG